MPSIVQRAIRDLPRLAERCVEERRRLQPVDTQAVETGAAVPRPSANVETVARACVLCPIGHPAELSALGPAKGVRKLAELLDSDASRAAWTGAARLRALLMSVPAESTLATARSAVKSWGQFADTALGARARTCHLRWMAS